MKPEFTAEEIENLVASDANMIGLMIAGRYRTGPEGVALARDIRDIVLALRSSPAVDGVGVKALEWVQSSFGGQAWRAHSLLGIYRAVGAGSFVWSFEGYDGSEAKQTGIASMDDAKAAAQADYDRRIRSALSPTSDRASAPKGWKWQMVPDYPEGQVVGPCICGSWPGGKCLHCPPTMPRSS